MIRADEDFRKCADDDLNRTSSKVSECRPGSLVKRPPPPSDGMCSLIAPGAVSDTAT